MMILAAPLQSSRAMTAFQARQSIVVRGIIILGADIGRLLVPGGILVNKEMTMHDNGVEGNANAEKRHHCLLCW